MLVRFVLPTTHWAVAQHSHICLDNRKLFFYEHKLFTKAQLDRHMRQGDDDDPSFRGHATCAFDKKTFFGKDDLYNHLERDHYHCFICRSNGVYNQYYDDYPNLVCNECPSMF